MRATNWDFMGALCFLAGVSLANFEPRVVMLALNAGLFGALAVGFLIRAGLEK